MRFLQLLAISTLLITGCTPPVNSVNPVDKHNVYYETSGIVQSVTITANDDSFCSLMTIEFEDRIEVFQYRPNSPFSVEKGKVNVLKVNKYNEIVSVQVEK